ncbi:MAG TPA: flagellar export protein FliJ [Solirubrobacteraceae bacterium]|jgi:flagellar FliJ protein|nr:flagellar export protein FliJ [Solirubrobacteraceae bacterium]
MAGPSFKFRLERVRALRERHEDSAKQAFAGAMMHCVQGEHAVQEAADRVAQARQAQLQATTAPVSATELLARQAYLERSESAHRATQEDLHRREQTLVQRRRELTEAARDRQALERLKEQRRNDHDREQARVETMTLDEIALNGFRRRAA